MRKLIAAFKTSVDSRIEGPDGFADWVDAWSEDYGLTPRIDACLLGAGMYAGYESYWSAMQAAPETPLPMTGRLPTAGELAWSRVAARTPHYVLSSRLDHARWPNTRFVRTLDDVADLKRGAGKDILVMGGPTLVTSLIDADLLDELHLIAYPLIAGAGKALFPPAARRRPLHMRDVHALQGGRLRVTYDLVA